MQPVISDYNFRKPKIGKAGLRSLSLQQYAKEPQGSVKLTLHTFTGYSWKKLEHTQLNGIERGLYGKDKLIVQISSLRRALEAWLNITCQYRVVSHS